MAKSNLQKIPVSTPLDKSKIVVQNKEFNDKLVFSFRVLEYNHEYYNCHGLCDKGIMNCFQKLAEYSKFTVNELYSGRGGDSIRFHSIKKEDVKDWPEYLTQNEQLEDSFVQISFGQSKGRAHGVLIDNIFFVIWLDPHHYLYHDKKFGPKRKWTRFDDCCSVRENIIEEQAIEIDKLKEELKAYQSLLDEATKPN